jgi:fumarate reductase subunit C
MRSYLLFGLTGLPYLLVGLVTLRAAWALGSGPAAWAEVAADFAHPLYLLFHLLTLVAVVFVGMRFFALFPKAQPPRGLPVKPPPAPVIRALLYGAWGVATLALIVVLGGIWP